MIDEKLILVDEHNRATGTATKTFVHQSGLLHRAFSIFLIDNNRRFLLQQRHPQKYHSGSLWANSCCGHPRAHEQTVQAAHRRLGEELGLNAILNFGFFARYQTALDNGMHENEFVYVYFGTLEAPPKPNPDEIISIDFLTLREIDRRIRREPNLFAHWLQHYVQSHYVEITKFIT